MATTRTIMQLLTTMQLPTIAYENKKSRFVKRDFGALPQGLEPWTP